MLFRSQAVAAFVIGQVGHEDGDQALGVGREIAPFPAFSQAVAKARLKSSTLCPSRILPAFAAFTLHLIGVLTFKTGTNHTATRRVRVC